MPMMLGQCLRGVCDCCEPDSDGNYAPFSVPKRLSEEEQRAWDAQYPVKIEFEVMTDEGLTRVTGSIDTKKPEAQQEG